MVRKFIYGTIFTTIIVLNSGCTTVTHTTNPKIISITKTLSADKLLQEISVGINKETDPASEALTILRSINIFNEVELLDVLSTPPDLKLINRQVNELTGVITFFQGKNITNLLYPLSLGVIPWVQAWPIRENYVLESPDQSDHVEIALEFKTYTVTGWLVPPILRIFKSWSKSPAR